MFKSLAKIGAHLREAPIHTLIVLLFIIGLAAAFVWIWHAYLLAHGDPALDRWLLSVYLAMTTLTFFLDFVSWLVRRVGWA